MGLGTPTVSAVMGQPLDMLIPLNLEGEGRVGVECLSADLESGGVRLPLDQIRIELQPVSDAGRQWVRVTTLSVIDEPVLTLRLTVTCNGRFSRQYTAFADPPVSASAASITAAPSQAAVLPLVSKVAAVAAPAGVAAQALESSRTKAKRPTRAASAAGLAKASGGDSMGTPVEVAQPPARSTLEKRVPHTRNPSAPEAASRLLLEVGGGPRLKMDLEAPLPGVSVLASAGEAEADPGQLLQRAQATLGKLREENAALQRAVQQARSAGPAETEAWPTWGVWLIGGALLVLGVGIGFGLHVRKQRRQAREWWSPAPEAEVRVGPETVVPNDPEDATPALATLDRALSPSAIPPVDSFFEQEPETRPGELGGGKPGGRPSSFPESAAREVSVEELLDLEQQADFFIALGQEDAAVEVLVSSLDGSGGQSPVPYTKLLEIYRQLDNRPAYDEIRDRFNRRFNVNAPEWNVGPHHGRSLEDYPGTMKELTGVWSTPLDAMAVLEGMLFRKDSSRDLFDLPAYRDLLLMYSIARENWQQQGSRSYDIDLLLPLNHRSPSDSSEDTSSPGFQIA